MHIPAIAYVYVILMMSLTEKSLVAGIMTFLTYCVLPLTLIVYLIGAAQRKRSKDTALNLQDLNNSTFDQATASEKVEPDISQEN